MTARQNAIEIIRFGRPQRVMGGPPQHVMAFHGCNHEGYDGGGHECPVGTRWTDIWGVGWEKRQEGIMGFPVHHPLEDPAALRTYAWPDPDDPRICSTIERARAAWTGEVFLAGSHRDTLWEKAYMLVGMERMMECFVAEPDFAREVLRRIMDFHLGIARHYLRCGVEMVNLSDDMGTQAGPLLGPRTVQEFLVPEYRRLFALYKSAGVMVNFHSCGRIDWMIPTLVELGVDMLNPVQASANDLDRVRRLTQGRIALIGAVSSATVMAGPVDAIRREVRTRLWQLGREGGYFCCADQHMPYPAENISALRRAVEQFGRYPLQAGPA